MALKNNDPKLYGSKGNAQNTINAIISGHKLLHSFALRMEMYNSSKRYFRKTFMIN